MSRFDRLASELVRHDTISELFDTVAFVFCVIALVAFLVGLQSGVCL